jgi:hypothetical protein
MTLPTSGSISFNNINVELGNTPTQTVSLNDTAVRTLLGVPSGIISLNDGYGKSNRVQINYIISSSTQELTLSPTTFTNYIAGKSDITITVNSEVYVWSNNTSNPGLIINGGLISGDTLKLVNNGYIIGKGGLGATGTYFTANSGFSGGSALKILTNITIDNYSYIAGGGGGGGAGTYPVYNTGVETGGGGGGAGGGNGGAGGYRGDRAGGIGGSIGNLGTNGFSTSINSGSGGGGGGRILPGIGGNGSNGSPGGYGGGAGGGGGGLVGLFGGNGGSSNSSGSIGNSKFVTGGGGGGWGASGGNGAPGGYSCPGGPGGKAIDLNGYSVTYINQGTVWGAVS